MNNYIKISLPPEMEAYADDLQYFVQTMVRKLHTNRHKGTAADLDISEMLLGLDAEYQEACEAFSEHGQFEFGVECVDVSNMAFLAARAAWQKTRKEYDEQRNRGTHDEK